MREADAAPSYDSQPTEILLIASMRPVGVSPASQTLLIGAPVTVDLNISGLAATPPTSSNS